MGASDSALVHPYPAITLCPSWTHDRNNMDTDNFTADYYLLRPIEMLVYSYQDGNWQVLNIFVSTVCDEHFN